LGGLLAKGGEGAVYEVAGRPDRVAKIYLKDVTPERADKLLAMQGLLTPRLAALTAWPDEVLRGSSGKVVGFLMPNLRGSKDIHTLYGPKSRLAEFPQADWRLLVRAALNTARAFAVLHESGCLVADVNHGGIRVAPDATVKLIDCDSFQVSSGQRTFVCEVGVENFTPPELQGKSFRVTPRTANHDNFGLAVMVFHLLMLGRHPFAGRFQGPEDMPIPKAIGQFRYAYSRDKGRTRMEPPPTAPVAAIAGPDILALWEKAFGPQGAQPGSRPTAELWVRALTALEKGFTRCPRHSGHYYNAAYGQCPWCPIESIGVALFPLPMGTGPAPVGGPFSLDAVWAQITAVQSPGPAPAVPKPTSPAPSAAATAAAGKRGLWKGAGVFAALAIFVTGCVVAPGAWFFAGLVGWAAGAWLAKQGPRVDPTPYQSRQGRAASQYHALSQRWAREATAESFDKKMAELMALRTEWLGLPALRQARFAKLLANRESTSRNQFLDGFELERATISGIGPAKKAMLESYGIETAADVNRQAVLRVPGFGPALTQRLLDWRAGLERRFKFNPSAAVDPRHVADMDRTIQQRKVEIEASLRKGPTELQQLRSTILTRRQALQSPLAQAAHELGQADADLKAIR
jgi:DNA-binding helix-hairpin-helix protein with protein kinase domain